MNYKEKIEEILQPMFQYEVQICTKCQHNFGEHYWGSGLDACRHEGCKCVADYGVYRTEVRNDSVPKSYVEQLTTLIEQAQKEAVRKDREAILKDILSNDHITAVEFEEQYLNQTKEDIKEEV